jgi:flagellin
MSIDLTLGSIGDVALKYARQQKNDSIKNLASGKKQDMVRKDTGSYSLGLRLENQKKYESGLSASLQNAMSIAQTQEEALNRMSNLLSKMNELAGMASSTGTLSADRENYQAAFAGFVDDFENIQSETFNGKNIFGNTMGTEEKQFLDSLKNNWLKATEDLIKQEYGWDPVPGDSWDLVIEENGATGGSAAFVMTAQYSNGTADVIKMSFDLPDFSAPHTQPESDTDRVVAHEMVHLLHAQNTYYADPTGDGSSSAKWLKEGLAEFIHGADDRVLSILDTSPSDGEITALIDAIGTGNESWSTSEQYASGYLAARYLDYEIKQAGQSGIKHMTQWMKSQFDAGAGASASGFNAYVTSFLNGRGYNSDDNEGFLQAFKGSGGTVSGLDYIKDANKFNYTNNINNADTGSVRGSDAGGTGGNLDTYAVIPDASGSPQSSYVEEVTEDPEPLVLGGGVSLNLSAISPLSFGDPSTYNLSTEYGANQVMTRVDELIELITNSLAQVGSNIGAIERSTNLVSMRQASLGNAISRVNDVSLPDESMNLARSDILINSNLLMRVQAKSIQQDVMLTLIS